jgi:hypothetical protein
VNRLEALYELAYLRVYAAWEMYLEALFLRFLCGYASRAGQETLVAGGYFQTLAAAETAVLSGGSFLLWHQTTKVIQRCKKFIKSGTPGCPAVMESVIASNQARLDHLACIRHRIVHTHQKDAKNNFDAATLHFVGRVYPGSRPGRFLRTRHTPNKRPRWLDATIREFARLLRQMV